MMHTLKTWVSNLVLACLISICFYGCASYHQRAFKVQQAFANGQLDRAASEVNASRILKKKRNKLLYYMEAGAIANVRGRYDESNAYLEKAYAALEDDQANIGNEALKYVMNPMMTDYRGENHEVIYIHYYKALNYLHLGNLDAALVEARRMENKLKRLNVKYKSKNKFQDDALIHLTMGLIYDANADYNNAFIAYRNAGNLYDGFYSAQLGISMPNQLKEDIIRTAYLSGFDTEGQRYEQKFNIKYKPNPKGSGTALIIWQNGLCPIKTEAGFTFTSQPGVGGNITFNSNGIVDGFSYPLPQDQNERANLTNLKSFRIAFPKYTSRLPLFNSASISVNDGTTYNLDLVENVEKVARVCLQDRFLNEMSTALIRIAIKKGAEAALRQAAKEAKKDNEKAGLEAAAVGLMLFNTFSEKADTRNWQTLPNAIFYTRVVKPEGKYAFTFNFNGAEKDSRTYEIPIKSNNTFFFTQHTLGANDVYPMDLMQAD